MTAVQNGPTSIIVTWIPPSPLGDTSGYRISFSGGGNSGSVDVTGGDTNSYSVTGLQNGQTYTVSIIGTSQHLFSDSTTVEVTLSERERSTVCHLKAIFYSSPSSRRGVGVSQFHNSHLHLPLLECCQWQGGQLGGGVETH